MHKRTPPRPCIVPDCKQRAAYQFLAIDGDQAHKLTRPNGARIRACTRHLDHVTRKCASETHMRIRAVPIGAAAVIQLEPVP